MHWFFALPCTIGESLAILPVCTWPPLALAHHTREFHMAKGKEARSTIKLKSEASDHCYFTQKNRNNSKERISLKKYDPTVRKHVTYKEASKV